jgi:hypothetical protein
MGKKAKEHRKKVAKRNAQIKQNQEKFQKMQKEMLMKLIEQEKQKGLFDNMPSVPNIPSINPNLDGPNFGPSI